MLQVDATLPRLPERQREPVRRDYRFSLLAYLLATGMVGSGAGLLGVPGSPSGKRQRARGDAGCGPFCFLP